LTPLPPAPISHNIQVALIKERVSALSRYIPINAGRRAAPRNPPVLTVAVETPALSYLIPSIFAELATATGFYYRKAEKENTKGGIVYDSVMAEQVSNGEYPEGGLTDES
jgi:hypothetical protein